MALPIARRLGMSSTLPSISSTLLGQRVNLNVWGISCRRPLDDFSDIIPERPELLNQNVANRSSGGHRKAEWVRNFSHSDRYGHRFERRQ
jgi:hypothetical protein